MSATLLNKEEIVRYGGLRVEGTAAAVARKRDVGDQGPVYVSDLFQTVTAEAIIRDLLHGIDGVVRQNDPRRYSIYLGLAGELMHRVADNIPALISDVTWRQDAEAEYYLNNTAPPHITSSFLNIMTALSKQGESRYEYYDETDESDPY
jgi:hypothetical protein